MGQDMFTQFSEAKHALMSTLILAHNDSSLSLMLASDDYAYGFGVIISPDFWLELWD